MTLDTPARPMPERVLRFRLGDQPFAADILHVREIRSFERPTRVAGASAELQGLIDLRGTAVPVIDLCQRLGLPARRGRDEGGAVIVIDLQGRLTGIVVDAVDDVQELPPAQLRPLPPLHGTQAQPHLLALIAHETGLVQLLDIAGLFGSAPRH